MKLKTIYKTLYWCAGFSFVFGVLLECLIVCSFSLVFSLIPALGDLKNGYKKKS